MNSFFECYLCEVVVGNTLKSHPQITEHIIVVAINVEGLEVHDSC
jgi:hypothetical protein